MENISKNDSIKKIVIKNSVTLIIKIILIALIFFLIFNYAFGITRVKTDDMSPSIRGGDLLIFYRIDKDYQNGDVVIAKIENKTFILRVSGIPGDMINIDEKEGRLLVNDAPEEHIAYYKTIKDENSNVKYPNKVEENKYFLTNDYRTSTEDSRKYGQIEKKYIIGKVIGKLQTRNI